MVENIIGIRVKEIRNSLGMSQQTFADTIEVSKGMVSLIESGKKKPSRDTVAKIANLGKTSADYVIGLSDYKNLDESQSSEVKTELHDMISKIEKLDEDKQKLILNMIKGAVNSLDD
ncbi:helix-turn-helix domain-containing protein [Bacillus cereus group sp. N21]|uniref:helix-turn-helix domain-containing protein n=1 Tax=Bacillus cereus group sp. N21 TaxID=2794591 RepID=UPI0018F39A34|nr:helix-turn-helix transcriptional regulator [Bacillus cereus group sp. N21]MBJ8031056.1 helix-turn-helix transcriptional regulator [Bacillus cereus group sp. N21]